MDGYRAPERLVGVPESRQRLAMRTFAQLIECAVPDLANPLATILATAMLLRHSLGLEEEATLIEKAVDAVLDAGFRTKDIARGGASLSTTEMADKVLDALKA